MKHEGHLIQNNGIKSKSKLFWGTREEEPHLGTSLVMESNIIKMSINK